ncbi:MAG: GNAT family N-acetyltransferase [Erythrobacter sp.]
MVEVRTARLLLRPAVRDDAQAFHAILSDPQAMAYWSTLPHRELAETQDWVAEMIAIPRGEGEDFVIECDGRVVGKAGLYRFPEVGFILHPDAWGKGHAAEALRPVLDRAFAVHRLPEVKADVDPRNTASLRLLTRLGFREVGRANRTWNIGGECCDSVYLQLDRPATFTSRG